MGVMKKFGTDAALEADDGVELDFGDNCVVRIHRAGGSNRKYAAELKRVTKPYEVALAAGTLDDGVMRALLAEVYAHAVVIDWQGVEVEGEPVACTPENVKQVFLDVPEFFMLVKGHAESAATFRTAQRECAKGN